MGIWKRVIRIWTILIFGVVLWTLFLEPDTTVLGVMLIISSFLSLYAAFFTDNRYTFTWLPPTLRYSWTKLFGADANRTINLIGAVIWLFVGIIVLRARTT